MATVQQTKTTKKLMSSRKNTELLQCLESWRIGSNLHVQPEGTAWINYRDPLSNGILSSPEKECDRSELHLWRNSPKLCLIGDWGSGGGREKRK